MFSNFINFYLVWDFFPIKTNPFADLIFLLSGIKKSKYAKNKNGSENICEINLLFINAYIRLLMLNKEISQDLHL